MTRDQARELFNASGLTFSVINQQSMQRLRTHINEQMIKSGCMLGTFRCRQRGIVKQTPNGLYAEIRCKADYFDNREAISFNTDGFIGFAGWADEKNVQPILSGFANWVRELKDS
jgi:hypothetical protein